MKKLVSLFFVAALFVVGCGDGGGGHRHYSPQPVYRRPVMVHPVKPMPVRPSVHRPPVFHAPVRRPMVPSHRSTPVRPPVRHSSPPRK